MGKMEEHALRFAYALEFFLGIYIRFHITYMIPIIVAWIIYELWYVKEIKWWKLLIVLGLGLTGIPFGTLEYHYLIFGLVYVPMGFIINLSKRFKEYLAS